MEKKAFGGVALSDLCMQGLLELVDVLEWDGKLCAVFCMVIDSDQLIWNVVWLLISKCVIFCAEEVDLN